MDRGRRELGITGLALMGGIAGLTPRAQGASNMHGLIGKMTAVTGQRDALIAILLEGIGNMPGCLSYIVAKDSTDENSIWITEVWDNEASHGASLKLPAVRAAITKGKPLIAGFGERFVTQPIGGPGLPKA
jgi:quinol monooxygenase YgiN